MGENLICEIDVGRCETRLFAKKPQTHLLLLGDAWRVRGDEIHECGEVVLELELEVAAQALEEEEGGAQGGGEEGRPLGGEQAVEVAAEGVLDEGEERGVGGDVVDARLQAHRQQLQAHREHRLAAALRAQQRRQEAEQLAHARQPVRHVAALAAASCLPGV